jgi:hypothetical protein
VRFGRKPKIVGRKWGGGIGEGDIARHLEILTPEQKREGTSHGGHGGNGGHGGKSDLAAWWVVRSATGLDDVAGFGRSGEPVAWYPGGTM